MNYFNNGKMYLTEDDHITVSRIYTDVESALWDFNDFAFPKTNRDMISKIKDVIFRDPATIVLWEDGTKTVVKCQKDKGDTYSKEVGLAMCLIKKLYGNKGNYNNIFNKWIKD